MSHFSHFLAVDMQYFKALRLSLSLSLQGSLEIFTGLGLILGPPVGGWFYQSFGYEVPFMLLGCLLMIMVPFNIYVLPTIGNFERFLHIVCSFSLSTVK